MFQNPNSWALVHILTRTYPRCFFLTLRCHNHNWSNPDHLLCVWRRFQMCGTITHKSSGLDQPCNYISAEHHITHQFQLVLLVCGFHLCVILFPIKRPGFTGDSPHSFFARGGRAGWNWCCFSSVDTTRLHHINHVVTCKHYPFVIFIFLYLLSYLPTQRFKSGHFGHEAKLPASARISLFWTLYQDDKVSFWCRVNRLAKSGQGACYRMALPELLIIS